MTINDLYKSGTEILLESNKDDADFDARCLIEYLFNIDSTQFLLKRSDEVTEESKNEYLTLICRRAKGEPLQYILGKWEFYSNEFYVGPGVLIPRPETEMLVDLAVDFLKDKKSPTVVDFCAGSGCIAISVAKLFPHAEIYAVEKYSEAFEYLKRNIAFSDVNNVTAVQGDVFDKNVLGDVVPDLILSNPPYIRSEDINSLSDEVLLEPKTALDGGVDGYVFYRFLCEYWFNERVKKGGAVMLECAEDQGDDIATMLEKNGNKVKVIKDFNGLQRVVTAYR